MKKIIMGMVLLGLTVLVSAGCGKMEKDNNVVEAIIHKEPPTMELHLISGEGESLLVKSCGYTWNWPEGPDMMGSAIADGPVPLSEGTHWDTLIVPQSGSSSEYSYRLTMEVTADELGIDVWDLADIGNSNAQSEQTVVYQRAEIAAEDFSISLQAGKVYEIYMKWNQENIDENGCFGIAYYVFKTDLPVQEDTKNASNGLTETVEKQSEFPEATFGEVYTEEINFIDGLTMTVTDVTHEGASLEILNQTDKEIIFGDDYELQSWQDDGWYRVDYIIDNWAFNAIGYETGPEGAKDSPLCLDVTWTYFHGILPAGRYRITKTASVQENDASVKYLLAAEFEVE